MTGPSYAHPDDDLPGPSDPTVPPAAETRRETRTTSHEPVPGRTRTGSLWVAVGAAAVVLLLLLIFILQNGSTIQINLFGANPDLPLGVALLLAAVLGALLVVLVGAARGVQLRHTARKIAKSR